MSSTLSFAIYGLPAYNRGYLGYPEGGEGGGPPPFQIQKGLKFSIKEFIKSDNDTNKRVGCIITDGD